MVEQPDVKLRPFSWEQAQEYLQWVNDPQIAHWLTRSLPVTELEHRGWYESIVKRQDAVVFSVMTPEGYYVGNVWLWGVHPVHRHAELRIVLGPKAKGKGLGTTACQALLRFAFEELNLNKVFLYVLAHNEAAVRCFEKAGFQREGLLAQEFYVSGHYRDALRMACLRRPA